jgi:hypothetical protein
LRVRSSPQPIDYDCGLSLQAAESNAFRIHSDLEPLICRIARATGLIPKSEAGRDGALRRPRAVSGAERALSVVELRTFCSARFTRLVTAQRAVPTTFRQGSTSEFGLIIPLRQLRFAAAIGTAKLPA